MCADPNCRQFDCKLCTKCICIHFSIGFTLHMHVRKTVEVCAACIKHKHIAIAEFEYVSFRFEQTFYIFVLVPVVNVLTIPAQHHHQKHAHAQRAHAKKNCLQLHLYIYTSEVLMSLKNIYVMCSSHSPAARTTHLQYYLNWIIFYLY